MGYSRPGAIFIFHAGFFRVGRSGSDKLGGTGCASLIAGMN